MSKPFAYFLSYSKNQEDDDGSGWFEKEDQLESVKDKEGAGMFAHPLYLNRKNKRTSLEHFYIIRIEHKGFGCGPFYLATEAGEREMQSRVNELNSKFTSSGLYEMKKKENYGSKLSLKEYSKNEENF